MGYYTDYNLERTDKHGCYIELTPEEENIRAKALYDIIYGTDDPVAAEYRKDIKYFSDIFYESLKWYEHDENMRKFTAMFPDEYYVLTGQGEDYLDIWKTLYCNGEEIQTIVAEFPDFD